MTKFFYFLFFIGLCISVSGQTEGVIKNNNSEIFYRVFGSGKPLLIINGGPGMNSNGFVGLAKKLSGQHQTIIYDQRGTGRSVLKKTDASTITMKLMVEDIERLRTHLKIEKWSILGHSFGGMLASYYTTIHPGKIESLILSSSGGIDLDLLSYVGTNINSKLNSTELDSLNYWTQKISAGDTSYYARLHRGMALAPAYLYDKKNVSLIAERLTQGNTAINNLVWADMQKIKFDCTRDLSSFNKPVLIIQGKQDIIEERTGTKAHKVFKNSRFVLLEHCGHYGWLDNEAAYFKEIKKFLSTD
jgi:proline iminopeptidase